MNKETAKNPIVVKGKSHDSWESMNKSEASINTNDETRGSWESKNKSEALSNFEDKTHKFRKSKHEHLTTATSECLIKPKESIGLANQLFWKGLDSDSLTRVVGFDTDSGQESEQIDSKGWFVQSVCLHKPCQ